MQVLRRILKWMFYAFGLVFVVVLGAWLLVPDEALHPEIESVLARPALPPAEENGYFLFWGIGASPELDAHAVGQQIVDAHEKIAVDGGSMKHFKIEPYLGPSPMLQPASSLRCSQDERNCLTFFRRAEQRARAEADTYAAYLERYRSLRRYPRFSERALSTHYFLSPLPPYPMFVAMSDLVDAGIALDLALPTAQQRGLVELADEMRTWRRIIHDSDTLITQMIATAVLHRKFRLASEIMHAYPEMVRTHADLFRDITAPLSTEQVGLARPLAGEFRFGFQAFHSLDLFVLESEGQEDLLDRAFTRLAMAGYKPNATTNLAYAVFKDNVRHFKKTPGEILAGQAELNARFADINPWRPDILFYNPFGKVLVGTGSIDFSDYAFRLYDLCGFSRLVDIQRRVIEEGVSQERLPDYLGVVGADLSDPYTGAPMHFEASERILSFAGQGSRAPRDGRMRVDLAWPLR